MWVNVVIIGCGRMGSALARELSNEGHNLSIVDRSKNRLDTLGSGFNGRRIKGIEYDNDVLEEAGLYDADVFLAVSPDDNINITACQIAKKVFNVPRTIGRICEPSKAIIYKKLEIESISPTQIGAYILKNRIEGDGVEILSSIDEEIDIVEVTIYKDKIKTVGELEAKFKCIVSAIMREEETVIPSKEDELYIGEKIICTISKKNKDKLLALVSKGVNI